MPARNCFFTTLVSLTWLALLFFASQALGQVDLEARRSIRTLEGSGDVFVGDFDENGHDDLVCLESSVLSFFGGRGDGTFDAPIPVHSLDGIQRGVLGDLDGDGRMDLVAMKYSGSTRGLFTFAGIGAPALFAPPVLTPLPSGPGRVQLADFNEDGFLDAVVPLFDDVLVMVGDGTGGFTVHASLGYVDANAPVTADLDGDGHQDIIGPSYSHPTRLFYGRGDGTFETPVLLHPTIENDTVAVADLRGSGTTDIITDDRSNGDILIFSNDGAGNFTITTISDSGQHGTDVIAAADFDGSGDLDILILGRHPSSSCGAATVSSLLLADGQGGFLAPRAEWSVPRPSAISLGDFNGDGKLDTAISGTDGQSVGIHLGDGQGGLGPFSATVSLPFLPTHVSPARDWTGDGFLDVIVASDFNDGVSSNRVWLYAGTETGTFEPHTLITTDHGAIDFASGDFNRDGHLDVAMVSRRPKCRTYLGDGTGGFILDRTFNSPADLLTVEVGDLNEDGYPDVCLYVALENSSELRVHLSNGSGNYHPLETHGLGVSPAYGQTAQADFDQDGHLDVATPRGIRYGNGLGGFSSGSTPGSTGSDIQFADLNGDSLLDIVLVASGLVRVRHNDGNRSFTEVEAHPLPSAEEVEIVDLDGDGALDIVAASGDTYEVMILRNRGDGTFETLPHAFGAAPIHGAVSLTSGEFSRDDRPDIVLVSECGRNLSLLVNRSPGYPDVVDRCLRGGVNAGMGNLVPTLTVNGSIGEGTGRTLSLASDDPLTIDMNASPFDALRGEESRFAVFIWTRVPREDQLVTLPLNAGCLAYNIPATGTVRLPKRTWNNLLHLPIIGNPDFASTPAPSTVFELPQGTGTRVTFTIQGLIEDRGAQGGFPVSPTNAIIVDVAP